MGFCLKDIYSDFDNHSEVGEGGSGSHLGINDAVQAGMSCFRTCGGGSFPYLPGGLCGGTGQVTHDLPTHNSDNHRVKNSLRFLGKLWAE